MLQIEDGDFSGYIYGGLTDYCNATGNTVNITKGTFGKDVYGGYSGLGSATGNTVNITGGTFNSKIVGGGYGFSNDDTGRRISKKVHTAYNRSTAFTYFCN